MEHKITLVYDDKKWENIPGGKKYNGHPLADGDNETLPSYIELLQALQLAIAEVQGSQPNLKKQD